MKGKILDYSTRENSGAIAGSDGIRYSFTGSEWKEDRPPSKGMPLDFDTDGDIAKGIYLDLVGSNVPTGSKSKAAATLWGAFLGGFGAHKFYMGSWGWGIVYLLFFWTYIPFLIALVEWIRYVLMTDEEFYTKVNDFESGPFSFYW